MTADSSEFARQRALDVYRVVDTLPEAAYDDLVQLAAQLCGVQSALISLIDRDRQWFKARTGFAMSEGRRDEAFCDHAIRSPGQLLEVRDATDDPRFVDNPLVTDGPKIRFYAGMPLVTPGGAAIGTVCVLGNEPHALNDTQRAGLASLARLTMNLFEARRRERELESAALIATGAIVKQTLVEQAQNPRCTVAIFEVQDLAGATQRMGDRAMARALLRLHQLLEAELHSDADYSLDHSTGSAEFIVALPGSDTAATLRRLCSCLPEFEREYALRVLSGSASSESAGERIESVFQRADIALSHEKDNFRAGKSTST